MNYHRIMIEYQLRYFTFFNTPTIKWGFIHRQNKEFSVSLRGNSQSISVIRVEY